MGEKKLFIKFLLLIWVAVVLFAGCNKQENITPYTKTKLGTVSNVRADPAGGDAVTLLWDASADVNKEDYLGVRLSVIDESGNIFVPGFIVPKTVTDTTIVGLNGGNIYTFDLVSAVVPGSTNYDSSDHVTIQWAPASRFPFDQDSSITIREFDPDSSVACGIQFFNTESDTIGPRVVKIDTASGWQHKVDAILIQLPNSSTLVLQSADVVPPLQRRTRFSTFEFLSPDLNMARSAPPAPSTYTHQSIVIGPTPVTMGKLFFAVTNDTNYVRIFVERNQNSGQGLLFAGTYPDRRISIKVSYQTVPRVIYAKPQEEGNRHHRK